MEADKVQIVPISKLRESPDNPRRAFGDLSELVSSIKTHGILQSPVVRKTPEGLEIVLGHRRVRAAKLAGLKEISVVVRELSRQVALEEMLIENHQRDNINPMELAQGLATLMNDFNLNAEQVADRVGMSRSTVYAVTRLLDLPEVIQKAVVQGKLPAEGGKEIARIRGGRIQMAAFNEAMKLGKNGDKPTWRAIKRLVEDKYLGTSSVTKRLKKRSSADAAHERVAVIAARQLVVNRLLTNVGSAIDRRPQFNEADLRLMAIALAEIGEESARAVYARHDLRPDRLAKTGASQLRKLVLDLVLSQWATLDDDGEYSTAVKAVAKAYDQSISELTSAVEAMQNAEQLLNMKPTEQS